MSDTPATQPQRRQLSAWMVIGGVALLAVFGAITLAIVVTMLAPTPSPVPPGLDEAVLADGSVLVVHALTEGSNHLGLPQQAKSVWKRLLGIGEEIITFHAGSYGANSLTLWLARYDARTGQPLEFDRWAYSVIRSPDGGEAYDSTYAYRLTRRTHPHISTSSMSASRPFAPRSPVEKASYSHILNTSSLPQMRSTTGEVEIEIYHADDGRIATFSVPLPGGPPGAPTWSPDSLPSTQTDGDVAVTLTSLQSTLHNDGSEEFTRPRHEVHVETRVAQDGKSSSLWSYQHVRLLDALGNESYPSDCMLSSTETAWKVRVRLFRSDEAALLQGNSNGRVDGDSATGTIAAGEDLRQETENGISQERFVVEEIALPDADPATTPNTVEVQRSATIDGVRVTLLGVGGPGKGQYHSKSTHASRGTYSTGAGIQTEFDPPNAVLTIDNSKRHVALQVEGETPDHRLSLLVTDQSGVRLKTDHVHLMDDLRVWTFETDEWVTAINLYVIVQRARNVEFTVGPPVPVADD